MEKDQDKEVQNQVYHKVEKRKEIVRGINKMSYLSMKGKNEIIFRIMDINAKENYSVWGIKEHKYLRGNDPIASNDERIVPASETKWIKQTEFEENFPEYRKNRKMDRKVLFEGQEIMYPMPISVNTKLEELMAMVRSTGEDPMIKQYKVIKTGEGIATRYTVQLANRPIEAPVNIDEPVPEIMNIQLTEIEQKIVTAIKNLGKKYSFEQLKGNFTKPEYNITEDRARQIYEVYLK